MHFQNVSMVGAKYFLAIAAVVGSFGMVGLGGCAVEAASEEEGATKSAEEGMYYRSGDIWEHRDVNVCWDGGGFAAEKEWVREALRGQRSWSTRADLNFVGWGNCTSGSTGIRITPGTRMRTWSRSGNTVRMELDFSASPQTTWGRCISNGLSRSDCIRTVALHEFGHALAIAHEHNRPDTASAEPSCLPCTSDGDCRSGEYCEDGVCNQGSDGTATYGAYDDRSIMSYCSGAMDLSGMDLKGIDAVYGHRYVDPPRAADFDGDGRDDLLCHDVNDGYKWIDYADASGRFGRTDWTRAAYWCRLDGGELFKGDFNGDGRTDMLCHYNNDGHVFIDYADAEGAFHGTDYEFDDGWCSDESQRVLVGDFNGDGRDDLLCHDIDSGRKWIDYASVSGQLRGTDWTSAAGWCMVDSQRLFVGDFNGDGRSDLMCHDIQTGHKWIDYADSSGRFDGSDWSRTVHWCEHTWQSMYVGDFNGDGRDDLLCHGINEGQIWVDYADSSGRFLGTDWNRTAGFCSDNGSRLSVGNFDGARGDDLLCHSVTTGLKSIDYADASGRFNGADWNATNVWCEHSHQELH